MRGLLSPWTDDRLDEVAIDTHRLLASRVVPALLVAALTAHALGLGLALAWLAALTLGEILGRMVTGRFKPGVPASGVERAAFVLIALPINMIWAGLGAMFWLSPITDLKLAAVGIWAVVIVYTQNFRHQPAALMATSTLAPLACMVIFPFFFLDNHGVGSETARWGLLLVVPTTIVVMMTNRAAARRMDALTRGLREEHERAIEAARAKSTFIAVTSHELRTPMNGLLGMAHALAASPLDAHQRQQVEWMIKSGDNLMQVLNDVLDLSKVETGNVELRREDFAVAGLVGGVADTWREAATAKGLTLAVEIDPATAEWITSDRDRIRQVLSNLVSNAVKLTDEGGVSIRVSGSVPDRRGLVTVAFSVADTGPGVPKADQDRIFDSFTQAEDGLSRRHGGAGLGLTISRALARQMGGDLVLEPQATGAAFIFTIRAAEAAPAGPARLPDPDLSAPDLGAPRILMAEDNVINQMVVRAMLEGAGVVLTVVEDGQAALSAMSHERFDCILMDINMPVMDGIAALGAIRAGAAGDSAMPVIAVTASAMAGDRERFLKLGFDDYVGKPIKPLELLTAIGGALHRPPREALN